MSPDIKSPEDHILNHAESQFADEPRLAAAVDYFKENPLALSSRVVDFDFIVTKMNQLLKNGNVEEDKFRDLSLLESSLEGHDLPSLFSLALRNPSLKKGDGRLLVNIRRVFREAKGDDWEWAKSLENPQQMASGMLIEGFGLFLQKQTGNPDTKRNFVLAFEEVGIQFSNNSGLMKDVLPWMAEEIDDFPAAAQEAIKIAVE